jgi:cytochrome c-type biogenesis protein CcmE
MGSTLDRDLEKAIAGDPAEPYSTAAVELPADPPPPSRVATRRTAPVSRNVGLLVTLLVMAGALVALFLVGFKEAAIYSLPVDQFLDQREKLVDRRVRIEGELVPGTLEKRDQPCEYRFTAHKGGRELPIRYAQCVIPDTFRDVPEGGVQVTVEGKLPASGDGRFEATLVMAKCTSKYDPTTHKMKPEGDPGLVN